MEGLRLLPSGNQTYGLLENEPFVDDVPIETIRKSHVNGRFYGKSTIKMDDFPARKLHLHGISPSQPCLMTPEAIC